MTFLFDEGYQAELRAKALKVKERSELWAKAFGAALASDSPEPLIFLYKSLQGRSDVDPAIIEMARDSLQYVVKRKTENIAKMEKLLHQLELQKNPNGRTPFRKGVWTDGVQYFAPFRITGFKKLEKGYTIYGYASDTGTDRDGDAMTLPALQQMASAVNRGGMPVFVDHNHTLDNQVGTWTKAEVTTDGKLYVEGSLEDEKYNPKVGMILHRLEGNNIGLSIGGDLARSHNEAGIRKLDEVELYEISLVGLPSNERASVQGYRFEE